MSIAITREDVINWICEEFENAKNDNWLPQLLEAIGDKVESEEVARLEAENTWLKDRLAAIERAAEGLPKMQPVGTVRHWNVGGAGEFHSVEGKGWQGLPDGTTLYWISPEPAGTCFKCGHATHPDACVNVAPSQEQVAPMVAMTNPETREMVLELCDQLEMEEDRTRVPGDPKNELIANVRKLFGGQQ